MTVLEVLGPIEMRRWMQVFADALSVHREAINRLNVYPVPDGDTGTNMALTLRSVVAELEATGEAPDLGAVCGAVSHGSLMGARGNSGVILSQILRGVSEVARSGPLGAGGLARALDRAATAARDAVMRPVEGTILTVARDAADAAVAAAEAARSLTDVVVEARAAGGVSLARTPELLPVLADAGVVDAGGAGFLLLLDAALHVVDGRPLPSPDSSASPPRPAVAGRPDVSEAEGALLAAAHGGGDDVSDLRYEVMFLLEAPDETIPAFKDVWAGVGDSIVVVGGDGLWNCHIHTDDIGAAIDAAVDCGRPRRIRVTDLQEQVEEERWVREAEVGVEAPAVPDEPVTTGVVAVATGDGIRRIFHSLGVKRVVTGGQTMNPSTAELLDAVEATPASQVIILPNNKNIVPVAEQVDSQTGKQVVVVPTRGVAEGFASLLAYDPEADADANAAAMAAAAAAVVPGEVTRAVRSSTCDLGPIAEGDWLGMGRAGIISVSPALDEACTLLLDRLLEDDHELVTLIEGDGASDAVTRHITVWLEEHHGGVETEVHHGGQPLYPYLFGIE